jgi:spermidine synthase
MFFERIIESSQSDFNGRIEVVSSLAWGKYIRVGGITQSGGVVEKIWRSVFKKIKGDFKEILILGLGGGSVAKVLRGRFKKARITGVEIDPLMVNFGKKYLGLDNSKVKIEVEDAKKWLLENKKKFDLIIVDIYQGKTYPPFFESDLFLKFLKSHLVVGGIVVFNRLYSSDLTVRKSAVKFGDKLEKEFKEVNRIYPLANLIFVCRI